MLTYLFTLPQHPLSQLQQIPNRDSREGRSCIHCVPRTLTPHLYYQFPRLTTFYLIVFSGPQTCSAFFAETILLLPLVLKDAMIQSVLGDMVPFTYAHMMWCDVMRRNVENPPKTDFILSWIGSWNLMDDFINLASWLWQWFRDRNSIDLQPSLFCLT